MNFKRILRNTICIVIIIAVVAAAVLISSLKKVSISYGVDKDIISYISCGDEIADASDKVISKGNMSITLSENDHVKLLIDNKEAFSVAGRNNCFSSNDFENSSVFSIEYVDENGKTAQMHSSEYVEKGQFRTYVKDNELYVQYLLGEEAEKSAFPLIVSKEKFEKRVLSKLNDDDRAFLERQYFLYSLSNMDDENYKNAMLVEYPSLKNGDIYALVTPSIKSDSIIGRRLISVFEKAGYTYSDITDDNAEHGIEAINPLSFLVTLKYSLTESGLKLSVPSQLLRYYRKTPITKITFFRYLCSVSYDETGTVVLPCGTGSLISVGGSTDNEIYGSFSFDIYGRDLSEKQGDIIHDTVKEPKATLPIYGFYTEECGVFAEIEGGAANVKLTASKTENGAYAYPTYTVLQTGETGRGGQNASLVIGNGQTAEDFAITFTLFNYKCDYNDFVKYYRKELTARGLFKAAKQVDEPYFFAEIVGNVKIEDYFLNTFSYQKTMVLTDYDDAAEIIKSIGSSGIESLGVKLSGWNNGGYLSQYPGKISFNSAMGGTGGFKRFLTEMNELETEAYIGLSYPYYYNRSAVSAGKHVAQYIDKEKMQIKQRNPVSAFNDYGFPTDVIAPAYFADITGKYLKNLSGYECGFDLENFATDINTDYNTNNFSDRSTTKKYVEKELSRLNEEGIRLTAKDANLYALQYISLLSDVSYSASLPEIIDSQIPMKQMLIHGQKAYCISPEDDAAGAEHALLSAIESGSGLFYTFIANESHLLKNTEYSTLNNNVFSNCGEAAIKSYKLLNEALDGLWEVNISKHRLISSDLVCVEYENGEKIYVNYGYDDITIGEKTISARSYMRCR